MESINNPTLNLNREKEYSLFSTKINFSYRKCTLSKHSEYILLIKILCKYLSYLYIYNSDVIVFQLTFQALASLIFLINCKPVF